MQIQAQRIARGQKITENGLYIMPIDWYHDDCCDGPSVSSTGLRQILDCPTKYWNSSYLNPDREPPARKRAWDFGKAAHAFLVEGGISPKEIAISPYPEFRTKEAKAWKAKAEKIGLTIIKPEDLQTIAGMYQRLSQHPIVRAGGLDGLVEHSLIWKDEATGIWLKTRPDVIPLDVLIADYKTVADASKFAVSRSVAGYGYFVQLGLVFMGMAEVLGIQAESAGLLCQEKSPPYVCAWYELTDSYIAAGVKEVRNALKLMREYLDSELWPGYVEDNSVIHPPQYIIDRAFGPDGPDIGTLDEITN